MSREKYISIDVAGSVIGMSGSKVVKIRKASAANVHNSRTRSPAAGRGSSDVRLSGQRPNCSVPGGGGGGANVLDSYNCYS